MRSLTFLAPLLAAGVLPLGSLHAQTIPPAPLTMVQPLPGTTDADKLADAMRRLGAAPRDLDALVQAGDLSFRLGDATAAAAFFKRAEAVSPSDPRIKAGIGRILVNGEHPGEALRYFDEATRAGLAPALVAGDRGLAYDLIGEQERAQRDYRLAMRGTDSDETRRRYALSLGISGKREEALTEIDALLRKSDRGAWRARAFILAMAGDVPGAERIANSMMPPGMATGLAPFFARLSQLGAIDRAFAVHFGEVSATPSRLADARLAPPLPVLGPDPSAPVKLAAVTQPSGNDRKRDDRRRGRDRDRGKPAAVARTDAATALLPPVPAASPTAPPTVLAAARVPAIAPVTAAASRIVSSAPVPSSTLSAPPALARTVGAADAPPPTVPSAATLARVPPIVTTPAASVPAGATRAATTSPSAAIPVAPAPSAPIVAATVAPPIATPSLATTIAPGPAAVPAQSTVATAGMAAATSTRGPTAAPAETAAASPPRLSEDTILARIIAGIAVPATELDVTPMPAQRVAAPSPTATLDDAAKAAERNVAADEEKRRAAGEARRLPGGPAAKPALRIAAADDTAGGKHVTVDRRGRKVVVAKSDTEEENSSGKKPSAGRKSTKIDTDERKPTGKKPTDRQGAKDKTDEAAPAAKSQVWVQVAGGATESDLAKAWNAAQAKAPALAGRKGYTTPLRATNRVITGPFQTEEEAQALVNKLAGQGVSAFTFTSVKGQKVMRVGVASGKGKADDAPIKPNGKPVKTTPAKSGKPAKGASTAATKSSRRK